MDDMNRRKFLGTVAGASAWTIVPRRVLGGPGYIAPSDMILLAQVGCGTQAQRQVNTGMVARPDLQFVAVVDPNKDSQNYRRLGAVRQPPAHSAVPRRRPRGAHRDTGIRAGRDVRQGIMETYYKKQNRPSAGIRSYEDYREMLEKETDIQGIVNITPDHQHGEHQHLGAEEGQGGDLAQAAGAACSHEVRRTLQVARDEPGRRASARLQQHARPAHARGVDQRRRHRHSARSAQLDEPSLLAAGLAGVSTRRARPCRPASTGSCGRAPSRIVRIIRTTRSAVYRGWYPTAPAASATWASTALAAVPHPESRRARSSSRRGRTTTPSSTRSTSATAGTCRWSACPKASVVRWRHPATAIRPSVDTFWYDGGMKPQTPEEMYEDNDDLADEGMLFIGDKGKILCDFRGNKPRLIPKSRQRAFEGSVAATERRHDDERRRVGERDPEPHEVEGQLRGGRAARRSGRRSRRSRCACPYKRLIWDASEDGVPELHARDQVRPEQDPRGVGHPDCASSQAPR